MRFGVSLFFAVAPWFPPAPMTFTCSAPFARELACSPDMFTNKFARPDSESGPAGLARLSSWIHRLALPRWRGNWPPGEYFVSFILRVLSRALPRVPRRGPCGRESYAKIGLGCLAYLSFRIHSLAPPQWWVNWLPRPYVFFSRAQSCAPSRICLPGISLLSVV